MEIPSYPDSRPLESSDKSSFDEIFIALQPRVSEFTFAGLYLFRRAHDYRVTVLDDSVIVIGKGYDGEPYFLPPFGGDTTSAVITLLEKGMELYGADEAFAARYLSSEGWSIVPDRDSFDYLYLREELATLPGNRFHKKKNHINYFLNRHAHEVSLYSNQYRQECAALLAFWHDVAVHKGTTPSLHLETESTAEALELAEQLGLEGVVILVNGRVKAFALGERLNRDTAVCHFEKADPFMEGLPQFVNREFSRLLFHECRYINREQDLGEPGLRSAKLSYQPVELIKKYRIRKTL